MGRISFRLPGDIRVPTRFFGRFTWRDLLRIGLPVLVATSTLQDASSIGSAAVTVLFGGAVGTGWYLFRPYGEHLDTHAYNAARWLIQKYSGEVSGVSHVGDGHVVLENGTAVGIIEVSPTNVDMLSEPEQGALHTLYKEVFASVSHPVQIYSRQEPSHLTGYTEFIEEQEVNRDELQKSYLEYCENLADDELSQTRHFLVLRVSHGDLTWLENRIPDWLPIDIESKVIGDTAVKELDSRSRDVLTAINSSELSATRVTGAELKRLATSLELRTKTYGATWTSQPYNDSIGEYRRTVCITEFPSTLDFGWTLQLLRASGLVDVTQIVRPKQPADASKKLRRLSEKLHAEIDSQLRQGYRGTNRLEGLLNDVEWFLDLLADREDTAVEYGVFITVHAPDQGRCQQTFEEVCNRLDTLQIEYQEPVFRTDQAQQATNPLYGDQLGETLFVPGSSAASGFPFSTHDSEQTNGVIYGVDTNDGTPVLLDRFQWSSHSMARMGMVGSGKSYAGKLELLRAALIYDDLHIIVVDPKQEYQHLVLTLGGTVETLESGTSYSFDQEITGFTVPERGQRENVDLLTEVVEQIYHEVSQDGRKTLVIIDEARILLNDEQGRQVLNQFVLEGRDTNTAVTLISQNASHFTHSREGREILDNMPGKVFMRHDRVPDDVVEYFNLSRQAEQELYELRTGTESEYSEALVKVSGRLDSRVKIEATPVEHAIIEAGGESS